MATAAEHLATFGVTVEQAHEFIFANLDNLGFILQVADTYEVTNAMLAEIVGGVSAADVVGYFSAHGLDSSILDPAPEPPPQDDPPPEEEPPPVYDEPPVYRLPIELTGVPGPDLS